MSAQWPDERNSENQQLYRNGAIDPKDALSQLLKGCPAKLPDTFNQAVAWVVRQGEDTSELERRMNGLSNELGLTAFPESVNLLMAWVCVQALAIAPSLQTWKNVRLLTSNSWQLEHWLADAIMVYVEHHPEIKDNYLKLAKEAIEALNNFQLTSAFHRYNKEREQLRDNWDENHEKLDEIWWGLRSFHSIAYTEEFPLFQVLAALDFDDFIEEISKLTNPYLIYSAFWAVGISSKFSFWEKFAANAPSAFVNDGTWNTSIIIPLLLVIARDQMLHVADHIPRINALATEVEKVKQEIANLTKAVVAILSKRQDASPLFARWSTWLMRQLLMSGVKETNNVRSSAFVDAAVIEAIGRELQGQAVIQDTPSDAPTWEAWCYRAVLASHANNGFIPVLECKNFLDEWTINIDDWTGDRGKQLRERASLIVTMTKEMPGYAAYLLAYSIAMSDSPVNVWVDLWNVIQPLREIVEFGAADTSEPNEYQGRIDAGELLFLVFCIGLAILDQRASHCLACDSPQARDLARLHEALFFAVREMCEIDDTLNREQWLQAIRHLAIRRLIWESRSTDIEKDGRFLVFLPEDTPTFSDYLIVVKNDVIELIAVLQMTLLNESNQQIIWDKLHATSIDLTKVIETAKHLNGISARKYPIDEAPLFSLISSKPKYR